MNYEPMLDPYTECKWCDGQGQLEVAAVYTVDGEAVMLAEAFTPHQMYQFPLIDCGRCLGTGDEPEMEQDPDRQRDAEIERKWHDVP